MKIPVANIVGVGIGLIAANYIYQALGPGDYFVASERSFFQAIAIIGVWVSAALKAEQRKD